MTSCVTGRSKRKIMREQVRIEKEFMRKKPIPPVFNDDEPVENQIIQRKQKNYDRVKKRCQRMDNQI